MYNHPFMVQHRKAIDNDNKIRLANARKNAEAIGRQRRYSQAMASEQADRDLKLRLAEIQAQARQANMHPFDKLPGEVIMRGGRRAKRVPAFNHASGARTGAFRIEYDPRT